MKTLLAAFAVALMMLPGAGAADLPRDAGTLSIETHDGGQFTLDRLAGTPTLVMFFSTDCRHCQNTTRILGPLYEEYREKGVEFVGVAMNPTAAENLGGFVERFAVKFPVGLGDRDKFFGFSSGGAMRYYPFLFLVDGKGVIQEEYQGSDRAYFADLPGNLRKSIEALLGGS